MYFMFKIKDNCQPADVYFHLELDGEDVDLYATVNGEECSVLSIRSNGHITRFPIENISLKKVLNLNEIGLIKTSEEVNSERHRK